MIKNHSIIVFILATCLPLTAAQKESEPNNTPNEADPLPLKGSLKAEISELEDRDYYYFINTSPQRDLARIRVTGSTSKFFLLLDILNSEKHALASTNSLNKKDIVLTVPLAKDGQIFMGVSSTNSSGERRRGSAGNYSIGIKTLNAYDNYEPNESFAGFSPLEQPTIKANLMDDIDVDFYRFQYAGRLRDRMELICNPRDDFRPELSLYDQGRKLIKTVKQTVPGKKARIEFTSKPGSFYYVCVDALNSLDGKEQAAGGDYTLSYKSLKAYDKREPDNDFFSAGIITPGEMISGNILDEADADYNRLELPKDHFYVYFHLENESDTLRPALDIYDARKVRLKSFVNERNGKDLKGYLTLTPERSYYFAVDAVNQHGNRQRASHGAYSLTVYTNTVDDFSDWE